ncbi:hypothetical protein ASC70_18495 [Caulobacter sp. Root343]|nr:hypothetical protein ASC62_01805 [Caulobacter sp. Root342]KQV65693.1 hypothetical protein ASC70_18495 [Caulobacter sp. Root343]
MGNVHALEELIAKARDHKMSPTERRAQRVSLIMGLRSGKSTLSREKVEELMDEREGADDR